MLDNHLRFLASVFVNAENVTPTNEDVALFMTLVEGVELFPRPILEQTSMSGDANRIGFVSSEGGWQVMLLRGRFDVARASTNPLAGSDLGAFEEFTGTASRILLLLVEHFGLRPHRLALVREALLREMTLDEATALADKLLRLPNVYQNRPLSEWDWRCVSEIERTFAGKSEPLNSITTIKKGGGVAFQTGASAPAIIPSKRIRFDTDVNTLPRFTEERFDAASIADFFSHGPGWHSEIESAVDQLVS